MAEAFFNNLSEYHEAISAGIDARDYSGRKIRELSEKVCRCMLEEGIDISDKLSKQLTKKLISQCELIVWIAPEEVPEYLNKDKLILWNIEDAGGKPYEFWRQVRDEIKKLVTDLIENIEHS